MRKSVFVCLSASMILCLATAPGQNTETGGTAPWTTSPIGRWETVDDATGKVTSVVAIWEANGRLYGRIEKLINPDPKDPDPRCTRCGREMKNKPLVGLRILWDLKQEGGQWAGGKILDPDNGKEYRCNLQVESGGKKLKVRGFIGFSLLGRTEYWLRED